MTDKTNPERKFIVHNVYLKDASFEAPNSPAVFRYDWQPETDLDIQMGQQHHQEDLYEVIVKIEIKAKIPKLVNQVAEEGGDTTPVMAFLVEVEQAGLFTMSGFSEEEREHTIATACPAIIYPYVREAISNLVLKGGFPQLVLPPMNFEAMYMRHLQEQQAGSNAPAQAESGYLK